MHYFLRLSLILIVVFMTTSYVFADEKVTSKSSNSATSLSFSASYLHQFNTNIDNSMDFKVNRALFKADIRTMQSENVYTGIGINYDFFDYTFGNIDKFNSVKPWGSIHDTNISANLLYIVDNNLRLFISPSFGFAGETGARFGDSIVYGAAGWASYKVSQKLVLGLGAGVYKKPDKVSAYPIIIIDWAVTDNTRLSNPLTPGPTGPAGIELSYSINNDLRIGAGGAYRSLRFRLDERDYLKKGIGEDRGFPLWIRMSYKAFKSGSLDILGGAMIGGRHKIADDDGNDIMREKYKPAPFMAVTFLMKF